MISTVQTGPGKWMWSNGVNERQQDLPEPGESKLPIMVDIVRRFAVGL